VYREMADEAADVANIAMMLAYAAERDGGE
jgi:hypothetical protein